MSLQFFKKLCVRKEPERGCLAKVTCAAPKDSSPILSLPPEVRASIFNYIIDDVSLTFEFSPDLKNARCLARWPEYQKKLSFLKVCKLFEAEALSLMQIRSICFEIDFPRPHRVSKIDRLLNAVPAPNLWNIGPQEVPLPLSRIKPHLRQVSLSPGTLVGLLETDIFSTLPRLETIYVQQRITTAPRGSEYCDALEMPSQRNELLVQSCQALSYCTPGRFDDERIVEGVTLPSNLSLTSILDRARLVTSVPIVVEVTMDYGQQAWHGSRIEAVYHPVVRNVSEIQFVYHWPGKNLISMQVEVWSQPMAMAFRSKETITMKLTAEELSVSHATDTPLDASTP